MLHALRISNIVLIDRLALDFGHGLSALTGQTGAGKSILLDALSLATGARGQTRLIREGEDQAVVTAEFDLTDLPFDTARNKINQLMADSGLDPSDYLIMRRLIRHDGRNRAFINDEPVSVTLLNQIGNQLVEIHGQFDTQSLLSPAAHRRLLDAYGDLAALSAQVEQAWNDYHTAKNARAEMEENIKQDRANEEFLRHAVDELEKLSPQPGEEDELATKRKILMHREQIISAMQACDQLIASEDGADILVNRALGQLERLADKTGQDLSAITAPLDRAAAELEEARSALEELSADIDFDATTQSEIDNRLFKLRSIARKHNVETDELPNLLDDLRKRLHAIHDRGDALMDLAKREQAAEREYEQLADRLHDKRTTTADRIEDAIHPELSDLKLENARFQVSITKMGRDRWGPHGKDAIEFLIATNPGMTPGPIQKIASGGELARLMLSLKVVLAGAASAPTLIFDEVDAGVGGAVADAVGRRLHTLGQQIQVLVVTHSPQVAARADHHWQIAKSSDAGRATTTIQAIEQSDRLEEIARMLAGQSVTDEARAAAKKLITADG